MLQIHCCSLYYTVRSTFVTLFGMRIYYIWRSLGVFSPLFISFLLSCPNHLLILFSWESVNRNRWRMLLLCSVYLPSCQNHCSSSFPPLSPLLLLATILLPIFPLIHFLWSLPFLSPVRLRKCLLLPFLHHLTLFLLHHLLFHSTYLLFSLLSLVSFVCVSTEWNNNLITSPIHLLDWFMCVKCLVVTQLLT